MPLAYISDEYYAALADVLVEIVSSDRQHTVVRSSPSGAVLADVPAGRYEMVFFKPGFGAKRIQAELDPARPLTVRLLSDSLLGYAWPKWCKGGDVVQFRVNAVEPYKLGLWRYGLQKEFVKNVGWFDNHGPRASMQTLPDGFFVETGARWDNGFGTVHKQTTLAPERTGLYYFHAKGESGAFCSFPLVVAPRKPGAAIAVLASSNTWNAYNPFGGRSNYILASRMIDRPVVNSKTDLPRYRLSDYGEWNADHYEPLSFDRPEPRNQVPERDQCGDPIEGRMECALAPAEWRTLGWLERQGYAYDFYSDYQLHAGELDLDRYRVLLLNVHPEYWSKEMYLRVKEWVFNKGGKLVYLGGNGINCRVEYPDEQTMVCLNKWDHSRESRFHCQVESEANLLGVVYTDPGAMTVAPYRVMRPDHWLFAGTKLKQGDLFGEKTLHERYGDGASGHETDKVSPSSPKNIEVVAKGLNPDEGGADLAYFDTPSGGEVFSAGSITYPTALLCDPTTSQITDNVLRRFLG